MPFDSTSVAGLARWTWLMVKILEAWASEPERARELPPGWASLERIEDVIGMAVEDALVRSSLERSCFAIVAVSREAIPGSVANLETQTGVRESFAFPRGRVSERALLVRHESPDGGLLMPVSEHVSRAFEIPIARAVPPFSRSAARTAERPAARLLAAAGAAITRWLRAIRSLIQARY